MKKQILLALMALSLLIANHLHSQVTIGSGAVPPKAAVLNIQSQAADATTNATSTTGGLLLPRVVLVNNYTLEPFIKTTDVEWDATNIAATKKEYVGLQVYHTNNATFGGEGIKYWDGEQWQTLINTIPPAVETPVSNYILTSDLKLTTDVCTYNPGLFQQYSGFKINVPTAGNYAAYMRLSVTIQYDATVPTCNSSWSAGAVSPFFVGIGTSAGPLSILETAGQGALTTDDRRGATPLVFFYLPNLQPDTDYYIYFYAPNRYQNRITIKASATGRPCDITLWPL